MIKKIIVILFLIFTNNYAYALSYIYPNQFYLKQLPPISDSLGVSGSNSGVPGYCVTINNIYGCYKANWWDLIIYIIP